MLEINELNIIDNLKCIECNNIINYKNEELQPYFLNFGKYMFLSVNCDKCPTRTVYQLHNDLFGIHIIDKMYCVYNGGKMI